MEVSPREARDVVHGGILTKGPRDRRIHRLPRSRLMDASMMNVREIAVCRAVCHDDVVRCEVQSACVGESSTYIVLQGVSVMHKT